MKKHGSMKIAAVCMSLLLATGVCFFPGCDKGAGVTVTLNMTDATLNPGETVRLAVETAPSGSEITWSSDNEQVATVDGDGTVTAVAEGSAAICAAAEGGSDYCQITVLAPGESVVDDEIKKEGYIYYEDFDERGNIVPGYFKKTLASGGTMSVEDGEMALRTYGTGTSFASYIFDEALSGRICAEARVKVESTSFSNILFFYRGEAGYDNGDVIACLGMDAGGFKNHSGGSNWDAPIKSYSINTWYDIRMELNIGKSRYDLWINGEKQPTQQFRNRGDGIEDRIKLLKFGTDKANAGLVYDYVRVSQVPDGYYYPEITQGASSMVIGVNEKVTLDYSVAGFPVPEITIRTDAEGAVADAETRTVDFDGVEPGTYRVTVSAANSLGVARADYTVVIRSDLNVLLDTNFDTLPTGMETAASNGAVNIINGRLVMETNASGSVNALARYDFGETLTGKVRVTTSVVNNSVSDDTFVNVLFFYTPGTTGFVASRCTSSLAIEKGYLKYNAGGWRDICKVSRGVTLNIEVLYDYDKGVMSVYLNGSLVLDEGKLRNPSLQTGVLIFGADKNGLNLSYDYMRIEKVTE